MVRSSLSPRAFSCEYCMLPGMRGLICKGQLTDLLALYPFGITNVISDWRNLLDISSTRLKDDKWDGLVTKWAESNHMCMLMPILLVAPAPLGLLRGGKYNLRDQILVSQFSPEASDNNVLLTRPQRRSWLRCNWLYERWPCQLLKSGMYCCHK